jgi:hypothetical protein
MLSPTLKRFKQETNMTKKLLSLCCLMAMLLSSSLFLTSAQAQTLAEIKLISPMEENRGWCVDLFAHLTGGITIGGFQGHNCFTYMGNGPTEDQAFIVENLQQKNEIRIAYFDHCMTLHEAKAGSFVAAEVCDERPSQQIELTQSGQIIPKIAPQLCLTLGPIAVPGGGGIPVHLIRKLSFETCDPAIAERQQWELRTKWEGLAQTKYDRPFADNPAGAFGPEAEAQKH